MPTPLPVSRFTSISILAPSSPGGVSPDSTWDRTMLMASSTLAGSPSNVAIRACICPPPVGRAPAYADALSPSLGHLNEAAERVHELHLLHRPALGVQEPRTRDHVGQSRTVEQMKL